MKQIPPSGEIPLRGPQVEVRCSISSVFVMAPPAQLPRYDYIVYIDESGDGLKAVKPCTFPGSSEWLVLSAVVIRASNEPSVANWVNDIRSGFKSRQAKALHSPTYLIRTRLGRAKKSPGWIFAALLSLPIRRACRGTQIQMPERYHLSAGFTVG